MHNQFGWVELEHANLVFVSVESAWTPSCGLVIHRIAPFYQLIWSGICENAILESMLSSFCD